MRPADEQGASFDRPLQAPTEQPADDPDPIAATPAATLNSSIARRDPNGSFVAPNLTATTAA